MGRSPRRKPIRLAGKLRAIREGLDLTQEQMIERLDGAQFRLYPASISLYEQGKREPPIPILLTYARIAGVPMEVLADDELDLPELLPANEGYKWVMKRVKVK